MCYAVLNVLKMTTGFLPFLIIFFGTNRNMKGFMQCRVTCPLIVATVMLKDMLFLTVQKIFMSYFVEIVVVLYILPLNAQKQE